MTRFRTGQLSAFAIVASLAMATSGLGATASAVVAPRPAPAQAKAASAADLLAGQPLRFEQNKGQFDPEVRFMARGRGYNLFLTPTEVVIVTTPPAPADKADKADKVDEAGQKLAGEPGQKLAGKPGQKPAGKPSQKPAGKPSQKPAAKPEPEVPVVVRMGLAGASRSARVTGEGRLGGVSNYFIGNDPTRWHTDVASFAGVRYRGVYRGVDLVFRDVAGSLEYDFEVAPGVDPAVIGLDITGAEPSVDGAGGLVLRAGSTVLRQS
ncbi:MAG TPA: hypothetical protein VMZ51_04845, partial [Acidimicrobiales bacterium]|nr:hypothetical protein [Acidimicrobiales bacterium]